MATYTITTDDPFDFNRLIVVEDLCRVQFSVDNVSWANDNRVAGVIETIRETANQWSRIDGCDESLRMARALVETLERLHAEEAALHSPGE